MSIRELLKPQHPPTRSAALLCATIAALLPACSPYPDDGEFFAGVVFARNFLAGVRRLTTAVQPPASNPAPPRAQSDERINAYSLLADTGTTSVTTTPTTAAPATSPLWANLYGPKVTRPDGTSVPLHTDTAQQVYVFDGNCQAPDDYKFDERVDLYRRDRQYPIFTDLPELLSSNGGRPGRLSAGSYSAIVEVIRVQIPSGFPCQSVKRWKTVTDRTAEKIPGDKIPMITSGYGRSDTADGGVFKWNFPLSGTYWVAADAIASIINYLARGDGTGALICLARTSLPASAS